MDLDFPFSEAFGRASTRNEMIISAEVVYNRLMHLSPEPDVLSFSVFKILLLQEDGDEDKDKRKALRNLFRPDRNDNLPLLSFVQTCDTVYKKIRYFRASVGNASVIDQVLESIIDVVFYFVLVLVVLSILNLNPWPLLVSMSTLLVTASFAVGPSCAKAIEVRTDANALELNSKVYNEINRSITLYFQGILLIVGRRFVATVSSKSTNHFRNFTHNSFPLLPTDHSISVIESSLQTRPEQLFQLWDHLGLLRVSKYSSLYHRGCWKVNFFVVLPTRHLAF
jgi:hypothetical protein